MQVPDFALELVYEAWSQWCLSALKRSGISSPICPAMSIDGETQSKSFVQRWMVFRLYMYMMCVWRIHLSLCHSFAYFLSKLECASSP
jgi:hypothetical protein